ncbi:MAG: hypothetical protein WCJ30_18155, partial [Deltaproteobacteria bacterium]
MVRAVSFRFTLFLTVALLAAGCTTDFDIHHLRPGDAGDATTAEGGLDVLAADGADATDVPEASTCGTCAAGETCCGTSCSDLHASSQHCGACDTACPGTLCVSGQCSGQCQLGRLDCDGNIVNGCEANAATDVHHCGACGRACRADQACNAGACECVTGMGDCDGLASTGCETMFDTDPRNCGGCGHS